MKLRKLLPYIEANNEIRIWTSSHVLLTDDPVYIGLPENVPFWLTELEVKPDWMMAFSDFEEDKESEDSTKELKNYIMIVLIDEEE